MKTEHILYIYSNTKYHSSGNDLIEFDAAVKKLNDKISSPSPLGNLDGGEYMGAYIAGMYPETAKAINFFQDEIAKYQESNYKITDTLMKSRAISTIKKFGLQFEYDFDCEPNAEQQKRINILVRQKQKSDLTEYAPAFLRDVGLALMNSTKDYHPVHKLIEKMKVINNIVSGIYNEDAVRKNLDINGATEGLEFLALKKQGILNDKLEIADIDRFCNAKIVKEFQVDGKVYDLSESLYKLHGYQPNNIIHKLESPTSSR